MKTFLAQSIARAFRVLLQPFCVPGERTVISGLALAVFVSSLVVSSAGTASTMNGFDVSNAIISVQEIRSGGPPRDGIPSIDRPRFLPARQATFLRPDDVVVSVTVAGQTRAYPLRILVKHEIVNDQLANRAIAVTYCPLCGTAMVFDRDLGGRRPTFGVSGLLYQSDVLMYDRQTQSLWSQLGMKAVAGPMVNTPLDWLVSEQMTFAAWRQQYPLGRVLAPPTSARDYERWPYASYDASPSPTFPVPKYRTELPAKSWVIAIIVNGTPKAYPMTALPANQAVEDVVNGTVIEVTLDPETRRAVVNDLASGSSIPQVAVYWFAWQAFYRQTRLWQP